RCIGDVLASAPPAGSVGVQPRQRPRRRSLLWRQSSGLALSLAYALSPSSAQTSEVETFAIPPGRLGCEHGRTSRRKRASRCYRGCHSAYASILDGAREDD